MKQPNILFIMADDHAAHAIGSYRSRINRTPGIDRIADDGIRFESCFCTNALGTPSRATVLTGTYSHINGATTLATTLDNRHVTFPKLLQEAGYQTAVVGKWHLGEGSAHHPAGFDYWCVLPGEGVYHDPAMIEMGEKETVPGYVTDLITEKSLDWLKQRDSERPFCLLCHHKAPHRPWEPAPRHVDRLRHTTIAEPETLYDDYRGRARAAAAATMRVDRDLFNTDLKDSAPEGLSSVERKQWKYQRYIKNYLSCIAAVDEGVSRILDYLDEEGLTEDTIVIYTSDHGSFLGDHGWYDKRFMYEPSLRIPFLIRYPREFRSHSVIRDMILNVDFAPTLLDLAGVPIPPDMQGRSFRPLLNGHVPDDWQTSMYYRYWMHLADHNVYAHYGVRTLRYKLIYYYAESADQPGAIDESREPEWELFDLENDPHEMNNVVDDPAYVEVVKDLKDELHRLQHHVGDTPCDEV